VPAGASVHVDLRVDYLDHAARDHLASWATRHRAGGGTVEILETRRHGRRAARRAGGIVSPLPATLRRDGGATAYPLPPALRPDMRAAPSPVRRDVAATAPMLRRDVRAAASPAR
jgi:hypothetical protein